jgi:hypothetical protein
VLSGEAANTNVKVSGFLWVLRFTPLSPNNKTDLHDITEILLKVALNTITLTLLQFST